MAVRNACSLAQKHQSNMRDFMRTAAAAATAVWRLLLRVAAATWLLRLLQRLLMLRERAVATAVATAIVGACVAAAVAVRAIAAATASMTATAATTTAAARARPVGPVEAVDALREARVVRSGVRSGLSGAVVYGSLAVVWRGLPQ